MPGARVDLSTSPCHSSISLPLDPSMVVEESLRETRSESLSNKTLTQLGCAYLSLFDTSEVAQKEFLQLIRQDPSSAAGYTGLGWSHLRLNSAAMSFRYNMGFTDPKAAPLTAINLFEKALDLDPDDTSANLGRAQAYVLLGRNEDAEVACRAALASCPDSGDTWDLLGNVLLRLRRYDEAIDAYERKIQTYTSKAVPILLSPLHKERRFDVMLTYQLVGDILLTLNRSREAIGHYQKALEIALDSPSLHQRLALAYYQSGEYVAYESERRILQEGCATADDLDDWCHYYEDLSYRISEYPANLELPFRVTNLLPSTFN